MSRFLEPAEIQALSYSAIPRVKLPERAGLFAARANRLRSLAHEESVIAGYLMLMAELADAQHDAIGRLTAPLFVPAAASMERASGQPLPKLEWSARDPAWKGVLRLLLSALLERNAEADKLRTACAFLARMDDETLEQTADNIIAMRYEMVESVSAPLVAAALQVAWVDAASRLEERQVPHPDAPGHCPVCGTAGLASVVRIGGREDGYRFIVCGLCATQSHMVRVKCSSCESTHGLFYQLLEGQPDWAKAESCDECHTYRKIFYQDRQHNVEPFADDLATLELDLAMNEAGYRRPAVHPFLWPTTDNLSPM